MQLDFSKMVIFGIIIFIVIALLSFYSFTLSKEILKDYQAEEKYERFKISSIEENP